MKALLVALLLLIVGTGAAAAECAWVLWSNLYLKSDYGPKLDEWDVADTTETHAACMARLDERAARAAKLRLIEQGESFRVWEPADKKPGLVTFTTLRCLPDTIDPRGPEGK